MFFSPAGRTPRCRFIEKVPLATEKDVKYLPPFPFLSHFLILYFFILVLYNSLKLCFFLHRNCRINFLSSLQLVVGLCLCLLSPPSSDCTHLQLKLLDKTVVKTAYASFRISNLACELCIFSRVFKAVSYIRTAEDQVMFSRVKHSLTFQSAIF